MTEPAPRRNRRWRLINNRAWHDRRSRLSHGSRNHRRRRAVNHCRAFVATTQRIANNAANVPNAEPPVEAAGAGALYGAETVGAVGVGARGALIVERAPIARPPLKLAASAKPTLAAAIAKTNNRFFMLQFSQKIHESPPLQRRGRCTHYTREPRH